MNLHVLSKSTLDYVKEYKYGDGVKFITFIYYL